MQVVNLSEKHGCLRQINNSLILFLKIKKHKHLFMLVFKIISGNIQIKKEAFI